ncbi:MAG: VCBS repeat-containing protein [Bacteroidetes bacterium]|nr:VCBS repeat-containing protein [Bacteroidota bacterium]
MRKSASYTLLTALFLSAAWTACNKNSDAEGEKLFELTDPKETGIEFINTVPENDTLNQFTYHYLFNGTGVATGDLNNDGLPELVFTANEKPAKIFLNKGDFKFEDISSKSGFKTSGWMSGVSLADVNNDGFLDIYICRSGPAWRTDEKRNFLFINNGNLTFTEKGKEFGVDDPGNSSCGTWLDYDLDGDMDLYLGNHAEKFYANINVPFKRSLDMDMHNQQHLYRNDGGKFTDVSEESGVKAMGYCLSATPADFNRDGLTDLYICNDYHIPDYYYINNGDGTFTESFSKYFKHTSTNSMGSDAADYNNDGWMDLVTVDMLAEDPRRFMLLSGFKEFEYFMTGVKNGYGYQYMHNTLQTNRGGGYFSDLGFLNGIARTDWSWSSVFADFDNDGLSDLYISNGYYRDVTNLDFITFQNRKMQQTKQQVSQKEILEKLPFEKLQNYAYKNTGNYSFKNVTADWGLQEPTLSTGAMYADLNNDGHLDLILCNQGDPVKVYRNVSRQGNYLKVQCKGSGKNNRFGVGTNLFVSNDSGTRVFEVQQTHGYQSVSEPVVHIGLGAASTLKKLTVVWPDGRFQELKDVKGNQLLTLEDKNANGKYDYTWEHKTLFAAANEGMGLDFRHEDKENPDFKREPLLPHRFSMLGPGAATGDVNGDRIPDLLVTNARESSGPKLYLQNQNSKLSPAPSQPWASMNDVDVTGCLIFDADADGDNDIYLVAGGSEYGWPDDRYRHRLYINDGKAGFTESRDALPRVISSGSCATAGDYDADGDLDLFVAGRVTPGMYPLVNCRSYLLRNDKGKFVDVTAFVAPDLQTPGMLCAAVFADYNNDNRLDLVLAGEWTPVAFLSYNGEKFVNQTGGAGTAPFAGWYNSILPVDIDNDGDLDFIAGNKGNNSFLQASAESPLKLYWTDLDNNGSNDLWMSYLRNGKEQSVFTLDEMAKAYPVFINKRFNTYADISTKSIGDIFGQENLAKNSLQAACFSSLLLRNNGGGTFTVTELPRLLQAGPVNGMVALDVDGNGYQDIVGIGNSFSPRTGHGRDDAFYGWVLLNDGNNLKYSDGVENGFTVPGDARGLVYLPLHNRRMGLIAMQNTAPALAFLCNEQKPFITAPAGSIKAKVTLKNGKTRMDNMCYGSGYMSCSAPGIWLTGDISKVEFVDAKGLASPVSLPLPN